MTEDEKKLMELVKEYASADCLMSEYAGPKEEEDEYRADRDAAGEAILAMYRLTRGHMGGLPAPVFEGTRFYLDEEGNKWIEDPHGTHGWWSEHPGGEDHGGVKLSPWPKERYSYEHGTPCEDGTVLRYYRRVG